MIAGLDSYLIKQSSYCDSVEETSTPSSVMKTKEGKSNTVQMATIQITAPFLCVTRTGPHITSLDVKIEKIVPDTYGLQRTLNRNVCKNHMESLLKT